METTILWSVMLDLVLECAVLASWIPVSALEFRIGPQVSELCGFVGMFVHAHGIPTSVPLLLILYYSSDENRT